MAIHIKTKEEVAIMREGGKILAEVIRKVVPMIKIGAVTGDIDRTAHKLIMDAGAKPAFLHYGGFPATTCISINDEIVHGVPAGRAIKDGDVVSFDIGVLHNNYHTDAAVTVIAGKGDEQKKKLVSVTRQALEIGISKARVGNRMGDIGSAIQEYVESQGFNVVRELVGHGVGLALHEEPQVLNFGKSSSGVELKEGMVLAIEPMVVTGDWRIAEEDFVFKTKDGGLAAHFEHTVAITGSGPKILTI